MKTEIPWDVYPRPQLRRESYVNLNGVWEFAAAKPGQSPDYSQTVTVPYPVGSQLSGVTETFPEDTVLWYRREVRLDAVPAHGRLLLHCGGVDQQAEVYVDGERVGALSTLEDTVELPPSARFVLDLAATDRLSEGIVPYGKQRYDRGGMWYTPYSGFWQTVWLELVPENYVKALRFTAIPGGVRIEAEGVRDGEIVCEGRTYPLSGGTAEVCPPEPEFWSPEHPRLYAFTLTAGEDVVASYFALRTLEIRTVDGVPRLCLNGKPYFFHGLLDQGWWPDGLSTPKEPADYERDILAMKRLGFNTLRKHIKVEPEIFYYDCDRLGMAVFQDMVNNGRYRFFHDTALPTVGFQRLRCPAREKNRAFRWSFLNHMEHTVRTLAAHPCIVYWTIFNEGWGQFDGSAAYDRLRALDQSRFIDTTSGWFRDSKTDVESRHVYFRKFRLPRAKKPVVLSEFGGCSLREPGHCLYEKNYGYRKMENREAFAAALAQLYRDEILPAIPKGLCAAIYTQLSDVEEETNGLLTYDRAVCKIRPETLDAVTEAVRAANR